MAGDPPEGHVVLWEECRHYFRTESQLIHDTYIQLHQKYFCLFYNYPQIPDILYTEASTLLQRKRSHISNTPQLLVWLPCV